MKITIGIIFTVGVLILAIFSGVWLIKDSIKKYKSRAFIYPKTGNEYYVENVVKMKNPSTREWVDAFQYIDIKTQERYIRERNDFLDKFVRLEAWEQEKKKTM